MKNLSAGVEPAVPVVASPGAKRSETERREVELSGAPGE